MVLTGDVIGICDLDTATVCKPTRDFLAAAEKEKRIISVAQDLPKSFVICRERGEILIYLSQLSVSTLLRRMETIEP